MFDVITNIFLFTAYVLILIIEFIIMRIFDVSSNTLYLVTTLMYIMIIIYQVLARTNDYIEKIKVRDILYRILDTINGIPLINKDGKIIIQWDIIFKKLIDKKEYLLYDNIIKAKTKTIDRYVNLYPSLLINNNLEMVENKDKIDTKSVIKGGEVIAGTDDKELSDKLKKTLNIKFLETDKVTFANYDSSISIDVVMNDESFPQEADDSGESNGIRQDGFSVVAYYKNKKYTIVPRTMVSGKRIDKEKWLYRNIGLIKECIDNIIAGEPDHQIIIDELSLEDVLYDFDEDRSEKVPRFHFVCIEDNFFIFSGTVDGEEVAKAYCIMEANRNNFEIKLIRFEILIDGKSEIIEDEKTIAIGSGYQPLLTVMEKMQLITNNIRLAAAKKDIEDLVIK